MTEEADFDAADLLVRDFLRTATPQQRHAYVCGTNLDDGTALVEVVLDDPTTDRATALAAYWLLGAGYYAQYASVDDAADYERPRWELLRRIEDRFLAGEYADHGIGFDPTDDDGDDWTEDYLDDEPVARAIPPAMLVAAPGEPVEGETEDGLPLDVYERYAALVG